MQSLRQSLAGDLLNRIHKELGREATLRLLWPQVVGSHLAANTQLRAVRGSTLVIAAPDRGWISSLRSLSQMMLDAVNRLGGEEAFERIEFVEAPSMALPPRATNADPCPQLGRSAVDVGATAIPSEALRDVFVQAAEKYFAGQRKRPNRHGHQEDHRS